MCVETSETLYYIQAEHRRLQTNNCSLLSQLSTRAYPKAEERLTGKEISDCAQRFLREPFDLSEATRGLQFPPDTPPIPFLPLYEDGWC
jgi:hypothetical protein